MGIPSYYSICPSQLKYQMKKFWLEVVVFKEQLLSSVPYATLCLCSLYTEQSINYFGQKLTFFFKFKVFQPLKLFLDILVYKPTWFKIQQCLPT